MKEVVFPDGISKIGERWFSETNIEVMTVPASVEEIDDDAFSNCRSLKRVEFAEGSRLKRIGYNCFRGSGLEEFRAPPKLQEICGGAFSTCEKLSFVVLNAGLKSIGRNAFF